MSVKKATNSNALLTFTSVALEPRSFNKLFAAVASVNCNYLGVKFVSDAHGNSTNAASACVATGTRVAI